MEEVECGWNQELRSYRGVGVAQQECGSERYIAEPRINNEARCHWRKVNTPSRTVQVHLFISGSHAIFNHTLIDILMIAGTKKSKTLLPPSLLGLGKPRRIYDVCYSRWTSSSDFLYARHGRQQQSSRKHRHSRSLPVPLDP